MKIENNRYLVEFCKEGGEISQFLDKKSGIQYMYQGDSPYWSGKNPTLFPIVGNTIDGTYEVKGKTYTFKNHGLIRYAVLDCIENLEDSITFQLKDNEESLKAYPFKFNYQITYTLKGSKLTIVYHIKNEDDEAMPFTFGLHPGFKTPLFENETYEDYILSFECDEELDQLVFDINKKEPHRYEKVKMKEFKLDYHLMEKYATLIYRNFTSSYVTLKGKEGHGVKVSVAGYPLLALWSPINAPFLCIEPWYSHADFEENNTLFKDREGMMELDPGKEFTTSYTIEVF